MHNLKSGIMYTTDQLTTLTNAISLGATKVQYADKTVEYRSMSDMLRLKAIMESELGLSSTSNRKKFVEFSRGYEKKNELGR